MIGTLLFAVVAGATARRWTGWWTAALFLVHPLQTEVVAHVSGRRDLLAALGSLAFLLLLLRPVDYRGRWRPPAAFVVFFLAVYAKESAIVTPVVFFGIEAAREMSVAARGPVAVLRGIVHRIRYRRWLYTSIVLYTTLLLVSLFAWAERVHSVPTRLAGVLGYYDTFHGGLDTLERLSVFGLALRLFVAPVQQTVDYSYDAFEFSTEGVRATTAMNAVLFCLVVVVVCVAARTRAWVGLGGLWAVAYYLPCAGIVPIPEVFAERFLYMPTMGLCLATVAIVETTFRNRRRALCRAVCFRFRDCEER
jgi:hypothetical protein